MIRFRKRMVCVFMLLLTLLGATSASKFSNMDQEKTFIDSKIALGTKSAPHANMMNNTVYIFIDLYQLVEVEERQGLLTVKLWIYVYYYLPELAWNETEVGIMSFDVPSRTFWKPDIINYGMTKLRYSGFDEQTVYSSGIVAAESTLQNVKISCTFDVFYFPFDSQSCSFQVGQWASNDGQYKLDIDRAFYGESNEMLLEYYEHSDQWVLNGKPTIKPTVRTFNSIRRYGVVEVNIKLARRHQFFLYVIMLPTIILVFLSALTFLLPVESGEKVSLAITILLSQIVGLVVLSDILPPSSQYFPLLGYYVIYSIILISISIIATVVVINMHHVGPRQQVPKFARKMMKSQLMPILLLNPIDDTRKVRPATIETTDSDSKPVTSGRGRNTTENIVGERSNMGDVCRKEKNDAERIAEWQQLACLIDRILLIVFLMASIIGTLVFLVRVLT